MRLFGGFWGYFEVPGRGDPSGPASGQVLETSQEEASWEVSQEGPKDAKRRKKPEIEKPPKKGVFRPHVRLSAILFCLKTIKNLSLIRRSEDLTIPAERRPLHGAVPAGRKNHSASC